MQEKITKILVDIDPSREAQPALLRALLFASVTPVDIMLYTCLYYPSVVANNFLTPKQFEKTKNAILNDNLEKLQKLIKQHNHLTNVVFHTNVRWHSPIYEGILQAAYKFNAQLVIKNTHKHTMLTRRLFNSTDWQLLKACPVPLLLVKDTDWSAKSTVVASLDPQHRLSQKSELDDRVLEFAHKVAKQLDMELHACHCFDPTYWEVLLESIKVAGIWTEVFPANVNSNETHVLNNLRDQHKSKFSQVCQKLIPNRANQHLITGDVETALPKTLVNLQAGIIVLGTTYRTGLLGSTAERLLEVVDCDVLAIKPKGFESPVH